MSHSILDIQNKLSEEMLDFIADDDEPSYTPAQIEVCMTLLSDFVSHLRGSVNNVEFALAQVQKLVLALNQLNDQCDGCLIETEQREDICELIDLVLAESGYQFEGDVTEEWREW